MCAAFRTRKCVNLRLSSVMLGNNQSSRGRTILEVLSAENSFDEANEMRAIQMISGA